MVQNYEGVSGAKSTGFFFVFCVCIVSEITSLMATYETGARICPTSYMAGFGEGDNLEPLSSMFLGSFKRQKSDMHVVGVRCVI